MIFLYGVEGLLDFVPGPSKFKLGSSKDSYSTKLRGNPIRLCVHDYV